MVVELQLALLHHRFGASFRRGVYDLACQWGAQRLLVRLLETFPLGMEGLEDRLLGLGCQSCHRLVLACQWVVVCQIGR